LSEEVVACSLESSFHAKDAFLSIVRRSLRLCKQLGVRMVRLKQQGGLDRIVERVANPDSNILPSVERYRYDERSFLEWKPIEQASKVICFLLRAPSG
jgi:hypothetical protein